MPLTRIPGTQAADGTYTEDDLILRDVTDHNVSTTKHGFVPKLPVSSDYFLAGDGSWKPGWLLPAPGGGGEIAYSTGLAWQKSTSVTILNDSTSAAIRCLIGSGLASVTSTDTASTILARRSIVKLFQAAATDALTQVTLRNATSSLIVRSDTVTGAVAISVYTAGAETFSVNQTGAVACRAFRLEDGSQGDGKVLKSDSDGNAYWDDLQAAAPSATKYFRCPVYDCHETIVHGGFTEIMHNGNGNMDFSNIEVNQWDFDYMQLMMISTNQDDRNMYLWRFNCYFHVRLPDWNINYHQARLRLFFLTFDGNDNLIEVLETDRKYVKAEYGIATDNAVYLIPNDHPDVQGYAGARLQLHGDALIKMGGDWDKGPRFFRPVIEYTEVGPSTPSSRIIIHEGFLEGHLLCRL